MAGGEISIRDNNTTGRFLKQEFSLETVVLAKDGDPLKAMEEMAAKPASSSSFWMWAPMWC